MKYPIIIIYKKLHVHGMALYPFMILRERSLRKNEVIMNHEFIHHRQQVEMLIVPFYILYLLNYFINRFRYPDHNSAYRNIIFEKEAYTHEANLQYLKHRKWFASIRFLW